MYALSTLNTTESALAYFRKNAIITSKSSKVFCPVKTYVNYLIIDNHFKIHSRHQKQQTSATTLKFEVIFNMFSTIESTGPLNVKCLHFWMKFVYTCPLSHLVAFAVVACCMLYVVVNHWSAQHQPHQTLAPPANMLGYAWVHRAACSSGCRP